MANKMSILFVFKNVQKFIYNIPIYIRNIKYGIENLVIWFPTIWKDRNWDYYYFFKILEKKLELFEQTHTNGIYLHWEPVAKNLKIAKNLCKRLSDEYDYYELANQDYKKVQYLQKQDIDLLCKIINKEVFKWWD